MVPHDLLGSTNHSTTMIWIWAFLESFGIFHMIMTKMWVLKLHHRRMPLSGLHLVKLCGCVTLAMSKTSILLTFDASRCLPLHFNSPLCIRCSEHGVSSSSIYGQDTVCATGARRVVVFVVVCLVIETHHGAHYSSTMILKLIWRSGGAYNLTDDGYVSASGESYRRLRGADIYVSEWAESLSECGVICPGASPKHLLGSVPAAAVLSRL